MTPENWSEKASSQSFYEVISYSCPHSVRNECDQTAPGQGKIVSVTTRNSEMDEYAQAYQIAYRDAPRCPIHNEKMIPLISKFV